MESPATSEHTVNTHLQKCVVDIEYFVGIRDACQAHKCLVYLQSPFFWSTFNLKILTQYTIISHPYTIELINSVYSAMYICTYIRYVYPFQSLVTTKFMALDIMQLEILSFLVRINMQTRIYSDCKE